jgi:hypothetical protein
LIRPGDVLSSVRAEPVEALRPFVKLRKGQAQGKRIMLFRAGSIIVFKTKTVVWPHFLFDPIFFVIERQSTQDPIKELNHDHCADPSPHDR